MGAEAIQPEKPEGPSERPSEPAAEAPADDAAAVASAAKEPILALVAIRDVGIVSALLTLWGTADLWAESTGLGLATLVSVVNGILVGAGITGLAHEWGHFVGARLSGATAPLAPAKGFLPLYDFDFQKSEVSQFQAMSIGGHVPTWGLVLLLAWALPLDSPGRIALVSAAVGFSLFASVVEFPVMSRVSGGMAPLESLSKIDRQTFTTAALSGAVGALLLAALL